MSYMYNDLRRTAADGGILMHWLGLPQPNVDLLPDTRGKYWPAEAWEKRAAWELLDDIPLRHFFFTKHTDNLTENKNLENRVSGDVFVLRVSDAIDENGRRFYVDTTPEELDRMDLRIIRDSIAVCLEAIDVLDDCYTKMSKWRGIAAHSPFSGMYAGIGWIRKVAGTMLRFVFLASRSDYPRNSLFTPTPSMRVLVNNT